MRLRLSSPIHADSLADPASITDFMHEQDYNPCC